MQGSPCSTRCAGRPHQSSPKLELTPWDWAGLSLRLRGKASGISRISAPGGGKR